MLSVTLTGPLLQMAPPPVSAKLSDNVLFDTVSRPPLKMPPPFALERLPEIVASVRMAVAPLKMAPPFGELPSSMVRPEMATVAPDSTWKTPTAPFPLTAMEPGPGPSMVRSWAMSMVLTRVMV